MPVLQEKWLNKPLEIVQDLFDKSRNSASPFWGVPEFFESKTNSHKELSQIPLLNTVPLHNLPDGCLVRYRAMVQDQFDPEFYFKVYNCQHRETKAESAHCGMYRDMAEQPAESDLLFEHQSNVTGDRLTLYCVPIPGETKWTKTLFEGAVDNVVNSLGDTSVCSQRCLKRPYTEESETQEMEVSEGVLESKRPRDTNNGTSSTVCSKQDMNFPLPNEQGPAAMVKVYSDFESFKVTSMVEFIGVLSMDLSLVNFEPVDSLAGQVDVETAAERKAHSPPPSLIPRLHTITARLLSHSCPLLPRDLTPPVNNEALSMLSCDFHVSRQTTLDMLTQTLLGDSMAAEYTLLHLISSVYGRTDVLALGKFTLNLTKCSPSLVESLHTLLDAVVPKCHLLSMSLDNMNKLRFSPKKDYQANRLMAGVLQLSDGTHLLVDETALSPGQLTEVGVSNLTALGNLIQWQKVTYDFQYHTTEFDCNLPVLLISEGAKSILQTDCQVPLAPTSGSPQSQSCQVTEKLLNQVRIYLALARMLQYTLSDTVKKNLEADFVSMRRSNSSVSAEVFHHLLCVSRLVALSQGCTELNMEHWSHAKQLEALRSKRLD